jgi:phosphoribosylanthranilate isomerase
MFGCGEALVKVCGITRQEDADYCLGIKVQLLGFIFHESSPRCVTPEQVAAIHTGEAMRVGVFVKQSPEEVLRIMARANLHMAQLHGDQDEAFCEALGKKRIMRVFWPERYEDMADLEADMERFAPWCRFFLLDAGAAGGGHGKTQDWLRLANLKRPKALFVAGGLGPQNILQVLRACNPCGIDLNSGVESAPGVKDHIKLKAVHDLLCGAAGENKARMRM